MDYKDGISAMWNHTSFIRRLNTEISPKSFQIPGLNKTFARNQINVTLKFCYSRGWVSQVRYTNIHVIEGRYQGDNLNTVE